MHLTSPVLPWILAVAAVIVFVLLVLGRPRFRRTAARMTSRAVGIVLLNVLVVGTCFLVLNNTYVFYTSWRDLLGTDGPAATSHHGASAANSAARKVPGPGLTRPQGAGDFRLPDPGKRLQHYTVRDVASGLTMKVDAYLPVGYDAAGTRDYPVILGLHGYPQGPSSFEKLNFLSTADRLTAEHRLAPSILVIPQIDNPRTLDTECVNGPTGSPQTDTWLSKEVPDWTMSHLHVKTTRDAWTTFGYSLGGWCAAELTVRHPSIFSSAEVLAGYFEPDFGKDYRPLTPEQTKEYDLVERVRTDPPPVAIWLFASKQDKLAYSTSHRFMQAAKAPTSVTGTIIAVGGHRDAVFEPFTEPALGWLGRTVQGFHPHGG